MMTKAKSNIFKILSIALAALLLSTARASEQVSATEVLLDEVVVTARKKSESINDVPVAVTALGAPQIEALKARDLEDLSVGIPNVAMDDVGTTRGTANFSIRGLGVNSSIPSIDPTVGTFIDGVYIGTNNGILFDMFDLESIEVLRGPQGTLFGRNVTGGAVLLNSKAPSEDFEARIKVALEGGGQELNSYAMGTVNGALSESVNGKLTFYSNQDDGYFKNEFNGEALGEQDTVFVRPSLTWVPSEDLTMTFRYEYMDSQGDGPAAQNHTNGSGISSPWANFDREGHAFSIDNEGVLDTETHFFNTQLNWDVGGGTLTNIFGWRAMEQYAEIDVDATPLSIFDSVSGLETEQLSNELRWTGEISNRAQLTFGAYYFTNEVNYDEERLFLRELSPNGSPLSSQSGGGNYTVDTLALFGSLDFNLNDRLTLNTGLRYTEEEKEAEIASFSLNIDSRCSVIEGSCELDFIDTQSWDNVSHKLGLTFDLDDDTMLYTHWTRSFRSGGYNLRNTSVDPSVEPGPFDEERTDNLELGFKRQFPSGARLSGALFYNQVKDMQREINVSDPVVGVVQIIDNTSDADIPGIEFEGLIPLSERLLLNASIGAIDPEYSNVKFDLNGDGVLNAADEALDLPRAAELTYSLGLTMDSELGHWGSATSRINYAYREESAYTDNNLGVINEQNILDAGIDFRSADGDWILGFYGRNLLDEVLHGGDTQLPNDIGGFPLGGTFSPLSEGRTYGIEATYNF